MARTKAVLGTGARLADYLSASLLARVIPAEVARLGVRARLGVTPALGSGLNTGSLEHPAAQSASSRRRSTRWRERRQCWVLVLGFPTT
jgi:hypothetical protein